MEFKNVNALNITDCLQALEIDRNVLKKTLSTIRNVADINASTIGAQSEGQSELRQIIIVRLQQLLQKDLVSYVSAKSLGQLTEYLHSYPDGLWREEATVRANGMRRTNEEKQFFAENKNTVSGCKKYLRRYPHGMFVNDANVIISDKKRRNVITLFAVVAAVVVAVAIVCFVNLHRVSYFNIDSSVNLGKRDGKVELDIDTDALPGNINFHKTSDWINVELDGKKLIVTAEPNHEEARTAIVQLYVYSTLFGFNLSKEHRTITITQESGLPTFLNVTRQMAEFGKWGDTMPRTIIATTNGMDLDVSCDVDWAEVTKTLTEDGDNLKAEISVSVGVNKGEYKEGTITVTAKDFQKTIRLTQESGLATIFDVSIYGQRSNSELIFREEGGEDKKLVYVKTNGTAWDVEAPYWLTIEKETDAGKLWVKAYSNTEQIRTGTIRISSNNRHVKEIFVKQWGDPTNLSVPYSALHYKTGGGTDSDISISNNSKKRLSTTCSDSWFSASVQGGNKIKIVCNSNKSDPPRSGAVKITCGHEYTILTIQQDGWKECRRCDGTGRVDCDNSSARWWPSQTPNFGARRFLHQTPHALWGWTNCGKCGGSGKIDCSRCKGKGREEKVYK